ncbi:hypothetical protein C8J56DRAFT_502233 [Mycena floridula]|nr:hypothetical protein C8J56DRAFT_502233 [Mycena floridula]
MSSLRRLPFFREEMDIDVVGAESVAEPVKRQEPQTIPVPPPISTNGSTSGTCTPKGEEWELDCEICHRKGMNIDEDVGIMCCEMCSKWQHMSCHDQAGRPPLLIYKSSLASFSTIPLWALSRLGITSDRKSLNAFIALWRHVGFYLGVDPAILSQYFGDVDVA